MILTNINDCSRYESLHAQFKPLFDYIKTHNLLDMPLGRIELDGDNLFINNVELADIKAENQPLELHEAYIDVHLLLRGKERVGWLPINKINSYSQEYNSENDCALTKELPSTYMELAPGDIVIVYPEDAHAPAICDGTIRKIIGKVRL